MRKAVIALKILHTRICATKIIYYCIACFLFQNILKKMLKEMDDGQVHIDRQDSSNTKRSDQLGLNIMSRFTDHAPSMERPWKKSLQPPSTRELEGKVKGRIT